MENPENKGGPRARPKSGDGVFFIWMKRQSANLSTNQLMLLNLASMLQS